MKTETSSLRSLIGLTIAILLAGGTLSCKKEKGSGQKAELSATAGQLNKRQQGLAMAGALFNSGMQAYQNGDASGALDAWSKALPILEKIKGTEWEQATCYKNIGVALQYMGKYEEMIQRQEQALAIYRTIKGAERDQADCYRNIGVALESMGKYEEAIQCQEQALTIYRTIKDTEGDQAASSANIGNALESMGKYEEGIQRQEQALAVFKTIKGAERDQAACYRNIGVALDDMGKYEEAIQRQEQALAILKTIKGAERDQAICYTNIGVALASMGKYEEAIQRQEQALAIFKSIKGTEREQSACCTNIGNALGDMGKYEEAIQRQEQALAIFKTIKGAERDQADCYRNIGVVLDSMGKYEEAIQRQEQALAILKTIKGAERDQAACYRNIGNALGNMGKYEEDIQRQEEALAIFETIKGADQDQAGCYQNIGSALGDMGKYEEAIQRQEQALAIYKTVNGAERDLAGCYVKIGIALIDLGKYEEAIQRQEQALAIYTTIKGTDRGQADCYTNIGVALNDMGKYKEAIQRQEQALAIYRTIKGTEREQACCYMNVGVELDDMGNHEEAIQRQEQALAIYKSIKGAEREQADCYVNIGISLGNMGKYEETIQRQEWALAIFKTIKGAEREQARCYVNIGVSLGDMGKYEEMIQRQEQALVIFKTIKGAEREQARCYVNIGVALGAMGKQEEAIQRQGEALAIFRTIKGTERDQGRCWGRIGNAHRAAKRFSEAIAAYENAAGVSGWWISRGLGLACSQRRLPGDEEKAIGHLLKAARHAEEVRSSVLASEYRAGIFVEPSQVFGDFVGFLTELDGRKRSSKEPALAQWTADDKAESVGLAAAFHYADRGKGRSLEDALREKSALKAVRPDTKLLAEDRELSLRISKLTSLREELPGTDERRKKLTEEIDSLQQRRNMIEVELKKTALGGYVAPDFRKPMEMAKELEPDRAVLQYSVGEKEGWLLIMTREGITAHKLGAETPALPELLPRQEATLIQLAEAWNKRADKIGLDGLVRLTRARAEDLGKRENERQNLVGAEQEKAILGRLADVALPDSALGELRKKGIHRLLVIPDGSLHYVPFAMLRLKNEKDAGTHYLVEEFASSYISAMTTLDTIRKQKQEREKKRPMVRRSLLAFANPSYGAENAPSVPPTVAAPDDMLTRVRSFRTDYYKGGGLRLTSLPETEQEAVRVASLFAPPKTYSKLTAEEPEGQAVVFTARGASEEQVKQLLAASVDPKARRQWQYVLFSTHGLADTYNGMLSCLALSSPAPESEEDGFLQAQEVMNLELDTDLVMLSACQTGLGRLRGGEGLVGLSAAFFYAGAESVCASLWQVPSGPTSQLVPEFFKRLKEGKVDRAEALRQAQLQVLRQGQGLDGKPADYSTPFCWAAFVLMGEYR